MIVTEALVSILLGLVFLASSIPKLRYPRGFVLTVLEYRILPPVFGRIYGWFLPPLELLLALLLLSGTMLRLTSVVLSLLLLSFIIAISINIARGRDLNCHCFGAKKQRKIGWELLVQDIILFGFAIMLTLLSPDWIDLAAWSLFRFFLPLGSLVAPLLCLGVAIGVTIALRRLPLQASSAVRKMRLLLWPTLPNKQ